MQKKKKTMFCLCCLSWKPLKDFNICQSCYLKICGDCSFDFMDQDKYCIDCFIHELNIYHDFNTADWEVVRA